jgi:tol-pal system protein YbgF
MTLLAGCAPQLDRIELSVQESREDIAAMQAESRRVQQEVASLAALMRLSADVGDATNAQRFATLAQVVDRLDQLTQKLDDNAAYMRDVSARVDLLATRVGVPTLGEYRPPAASQIALADLPEEGRSIFQAAQLDRSRGNLDLAREGFTEFLARYSESELADDAMYWLGDLDYGAGNWQSARDNFAALLATRPETDWAAAALLKSGYSLEKLGDAGEARKIFDELVTSYPESNEAALAKEAREALTSEDPRSEDPVNEDPVKEDPGDQ